jgi:hypothetical protein
MKKVKLTFTYGDIEGMLELAKTNTALRVLLDQAMVIYKLSKPVEEVNDNNFDHIDELIKAMIYSRRIK